MLLERGGIEGGGSVADMVAGKYICACGHIQLSHHTEDREAGDYCNGECLFNGCKCQEFRPDPFAHIVVPPAYKRYAKEFRDGWRSGETADGRWNPVTKGDPKRRKAWDAGKKAGKRFLQRGGEA